MPDLHSLGFRVMRLCRPSVLSDAPLRFDLDQDLASGWPDPSEASALPEDASTPFAQRIQIQQPVGHWGSEGLLELPQSFGMIYLGETFSSYISVGNNSDQTVSQITIKAELQTDRQKVALFDSSATPILSLAPGARHDFIVAHDVKEVGPHTLACSTVYITAAGERKYYPQYFKFASHNPLSVRTKTRTLRSKRGELQTLLEACVENATRGPLFLEYLRFEPSSHLSAEELPREEESAQDSGPAPTALERYVDALKLVDPGGSINTVWQVHTKHPSEAGSGEGPAASAALGKLEIKWRGMLGDPGRLQTQQIQSPTPLPKEVETTVQGLQGPLVVEQPFSLQLKLKRRGDMPMRSVAIQAGTVERSSNEGNIVIMHGGQDTVNLSQQEATATLNLLPLSRGLQHLPPLTLLDQTRAVVLDTLALSVLVEPSAA